MEQCLEVTQCLIEASTIPCKISESDYKLVAKFEPVQPEGVLQHCRTILEGNKDPPLPERPTVLEAPVNSESRFW